MAQTTIQGSFLGDGTVTGVKIGADFISAQTALTSGLATADEIIVSDAGVIKRMDISVWSAATITFTNKSIDLDANTLTGTIAEFNTALQSESFATLGGTETLVAKTLTTPTISSTGWTNALHAHAANNSGGTLDASVLGAGTLPAARIAADSIVEGKFNVSNGPTNGYVLTARDGVAGGFTWEAAASGGVDTTGTPANNQIAVFTDVDTVEGTTSLTYGTPIVAVSGKNTEALNITGDFRDYVNGPLQIKTTHTSSTQGYPGISFYQNDNTLLATFRPGLTSNDSGALSIGSAGNIYFAAGDADANANTFMKIGTTGAINMIKQPGFLYFNTVTDTNVTGNGAEIITDFDTKEFDQNDDFASDAFTAPVGGRYLLAWGVEIRGITSAMTRHENVLQTSNWKFMYNGNPANLREPGSDRFTFTGSVVATMDENDTVTVRINFINGAGNTADIYGNASYMRTFFSGWLMG